MLFVRCLRVKISGPLNAGTIGLLFFYIDFERFILSEVLSTKILHHQTLTVKINYLIVF